ncbi:MAG: helix-turn-helix transcriptional regulator [Bacteroidota bacterium]
MSEDHVDKRISQLEEHLRNNPHEINRGSVSDHSYYSYRHANRLFSSRKGESINAFANKIRLQKAAEHLRYSSKSIFDIAIEVGYETSASFSKAFKKMYGISPSNYRKQNKESDPTKLNKAANIHYSIESLSLPNLQCKKVLFDLSIEDEDFYILLKDSLASLNIESKEFLLLWDEDPYTLQSNKSRCFVATPSLAPVPSIDIPPPLEGKYAMFDTAAFLHMELDAWHKLAFLVLELDKLKIRVSTFIEYYSVDSLDHRDNFYPDRFGLSIE